MKKIFINGIQRTGTNYALSLFRQNLPNMFFTDDIDGNWKHGFYKTPFDITINKTITIIKHPGTWVESVCFRNCVDIIKIFPKYNLYDTSDYCGPFYINLRNLCKLYCDYYNSWLDKPNTYLVQYETLLSERKVKKNIIKYFEIKLDNIILPKKVNRSGNFKKEHIKNYEKYKIQYLNKKEIQVIKECLSKNFLKKIKYYI